MGGGGGPNKKGGGGAGRGGVGGPTKNPKINNRGELLFGSGEYWLIKSFH